MNTRRHLFTVGWIYAALGLLHLVPGAVIAIEQWGEMQRYSGTVGAGIALGLFTLGVLGAALSLVYFRVAAIYFGKAKGSRTGLPRIAVISLMALGIPYGTAAGIYALFVRRHVLGKSRRAANPKRGIPEPSEPQGHHGEHEVASGQGKNPEQHDGSPADERETESE